MIVGIDIGTSYSSICILDKNMRPEKIKVSTGISVFGGEYSLPSAIFVDEQSGIISVGQAAIANKMRNPENFKSEFKRELGEKTPYFLGGKQFMPEDLYKEIFMHLKNKAEEYSGEKISRAIVTHPATANFNETKKELIKNAALNAGLLNIELVDEPTAAGLFYIEDSNETVKDGEKFLIYDFGGGTFDLSIIAAKGNSFEPYTSSLGIERCGGIDIDLLIYNDILKTIGNESIEQLKNDPINLKRFLSKKLEISVIAKEHLSSDDLFSDLIEVGFSNKDYSLDINRFNSMIFPIINRTIEAVKEILIKSGLTIEEISKIILVGGSSRIPLVKKMLAKEVGGKIFSNTDPELAICKGAVLWDKFRDETNENKMDKIMYLLNEDNADCDFNKGFQMALKMAEEGSPIAQFLVGWCFEYDDGEIQNQEEAFKWYMKAAIQGASTAQFKVAECYLNGEGAEENVERAFEWATKAANQGLDTAELLLGDLYKSGIGVSKNDEIAFEWALKSAKQGNSGAQVRVGHSFYSGIGVDLNLEKAIEWFRKAAENENAEAQNMLGICYRDGQEVATNYEKAMEWFSKATENGDSYAPFHLACFYDEGEVVKEDNVKAFELYLKSAERGFDDAQYYTGLCYENGIGTKLNTQKAIEWYKKAVTQKNPEAQNKLGMIYSEKIGFVNQAEAFLLFFEAANQGLDIAQYNLGACYENGEGTKVNIQKAVEWYKKASDQELQFAQNALGMIYLEKEGYVNYSLAFQLFLKAANQGNADAQWNIGNCYEFGFGVDSSLTIAYKWWKKAADQGYELAIQRLDRNVFTSFFNGFVNYEKED